MPFPGVGLCEHLDGQSASSSFLQAACDCLTPRMIFQIPATRPLLLTPQPGFPKHSTALPAETDEPLLAKIVVFTEHLDTIRRGGALGCIKNCAMDRGSMGWLLASEGG